MERVLPQLAELIKPGAEENPFYAAFKRIPESIPAADRARLQADGKAAIENVVIPAYAKFEKFFRERYVPASRPTDGIWDTPDGLAFYQERARFHTTTNLTPDEIHQIGLKEVARIRAEMDNVIREVGFKGSFSEFLEFLRTDPKFYYKTPDELFRAYAVLAKQIDPELVKLFRKLPRTPYGVRPIPATSAPNTTTAYYQGPAADGSRAGYYYVNLYRPEVRPKYEMEVLTLHEAVPGHHLQISLAQEQTDLPAFRRNAEYTAFVEGWALYTESLGDRIGLYKDPYSRFGQLTYDMWRAVRLVVDTGIHAKHWTRQQAIDYFKANAAKTETDIINEVDRYISWPGQALAYKIGQLRILQLRTEAEQKLGPRFDIRDFHDEVLSNGALPLEVLDRQVKDWIARTAVEKGAAAAR
jgi:prolyl oligopeptidase